MKLTTLVTLAKKTTQKGTAYPAISLAKLVDVLVEDFDARVLKNQSTSAVLAIDSADGRNVEVTLSPTNAVIKARLEDSEYEDEEHGTTEEDDEVNSPVEDAAVLVGECLQKLTGWHADSLLGAFDANGLCPKCSVQCFEWQEHCPRCGVDLEAPSEAAPTDVFDRKGQALARALLDSDLVELTTKSAREAFESKLSWLYSTKKVTPTRLMDTLLDLPSVAEVYASEEDLDNALTAIRSDR